MATLVLQSAGAAVGGLFGGPLGAMLGQAVGAGLGASIDQRLFGGDDRVIEGPRLGEVQILSSREGAPIPRVFGTNRVAGEIIWATRLEEEQTVEEVSQGGKGGGPSTQQVSYAYFGNFAIGLCEGVIAGIGRIWADGRLVDQNRNTIRLHRGTRSQAPDSLISAKQGAGNAPGYRNLAYLVFERFPLETFGNRIPQISVEIIRPVGEIEKHIRGVNLIPGASEFVYDTERVDETLSVGRVAKLNLHQMRAPSDIIASLDELQMLCPNLEQVAIVCAWFGDDLRADQCKIEPRAETDTRTIHEGDDWRVASFDRTNARLVSQYQGRPVYGGTPSDASVVRLIEEIRARGLKVAMHPFVLMDVLSGNNLRDPYGGVSQAPLPWRGRITCHPSPEQSGSPQGSNAINGIVDDFLGNATLQQIDIAGDAISHGTTSDWGYRRFILHHARLAQLAGGVDMFILGSEFRGMTRLHTAAEQFPFVEGLMQLAGDVKSVLGNGCDVTYGADWSEYFGYQPADGAGDVFYNLDPLWASSDIDCIGIDNYMPLSDFRSTGDPGGNGRAQQDPAMLASQIAGGEGFDWYYASTGARRAGNRTAITDDAGKPWVFRYKDLISWWSNPHCDRRGGTEVSSTSPWQPQSKPIIFTEFGCPAIDNGPAQPNVFFDPKSSESAAPYFSTGTRDDAAQSAYLAVTQAHWDADHPDFSPSNNPISSVYGKRMVDMARSNIWAWDARPWPAFPERIDLWSDGDNWSTGHWLNGRLGRLRLADLIRALMEEADIDDIDVSQVYGQIDGYVIAETTTPRAALEALVSLYRLAVFERAGTIVFRSPGIDDEQAIARNALVEVDQQPLLSVRSVQAEDLPDRIQLHHRDSMREYRDTQVHASREPVSPGQARTYALPASIAPVVIEPVVSRLLQSTWVGRQTAKLTLPLSFLGLTNGDTLLLPWHDPLQLWEIVGIKTAEALELDLRAVDRGAHLSSAGIATRPDETPVLPDAGAPQVVFLDLPILPGSTPANANRIAVSATPWTGPQAVFSSLTQSDYTYRQTVTRRAGIGQLEWSLPPTVICSRWNRKDELVVRMHSGALSSASRLSVLGGANTLAVKCTSGAFEIVQFQEAELIDNQVWRLRNLLRGQLGTEPEAELGANLGASVVRLDASVTALVNGARDRGKPLNWRIGALNTPLDDPDQAVAQFAPGYRGLMPYRPVHLRASRLANGDLQVSWVRRDRLAFDDWQMIEIPMSETDQVYKTAITQGSTSVEYTTNTPELTLSAAQLSGAFGSASGTFSIDVAQVSPEFGAGPSTSTTFQLP